MSRVKEQLAQLSRFHTMVLLVMVSVLGYLSYEIVRPFLRPIGWAIVLSIIFHPLYDFVNRFVTAKSLTSVIAVIVIVVMILVPLLYFSLLLVVEVRHVLTTLQAHQVDPMTGTLQHPVVRSVIEGVSQLLAMPEAQMYAAVKERAASIGKSLVERLPGGIGAVLSGIIDALLMVFTLFFMLRDGPTLLERAKGYLPFSKAQDERLFAQTRDIVVSTIYGGVAVGLIQGVVAGVMFSLLGVSSPVLWGFATFVASFVPLFGTSLVWVPVTAYLFLSGAMAKGLILAIFGVVVISSIDNLLKPLIIGGKAKMPVLVILFSILGGINLFGLIGLVLGPLVIAVFVSIVEIFRSSEEEKHAEQV